MAVFTLNFNIMSPSSTDDIERWCLDSPTPMLEVTEETLRSGLSLRGWILSRGDKNIQPVFLSDNTVEPLALNENRPDVIEKVLGDKPNNHPKLSCGFNHTVCLKASYFQIGVVQDGRFISLIECSIEGVLKVLHGREGWLFLDNDTNNSVEQFKGTLKLSRQEQKAWKVYFNKLLMLKDKQAVSVCMLIAPSKELVYTDYYPYEKKRKTTIDQLVSLVPESLDLVFPVRELQISHKRSYRVCDTHWSHYGSMVATLALLSKHKNDISRATLIFDEDKYRTRHVTGDLGNKLYPLMKHDEEFLSSFNHQIFIVFDNHLSNFGRIKVMHYTSAIYDEVLLILGSSSSYTMFNYVSRIYKTVVFFHSAGNIDYQFVASIKPDFVVAQSNARFIVKAPIADDDFSTYLKQKFDTVSQDERPIPSIDDEAISISDDSKLKAIVKYLKSLNNEAFNIPLRD